MLAVVKELSISQGFFQDAESSRRVIVLSVILGFDQMTRIERLQVQVFAKSPSVLTPGPTGQVGDAAMEHDESETFAPAGKAWMLSQESVARVLA